MRAVWGAQRANPVRYTHLTTREHNRLTPTQAQTVIAAANLRHLHAVVTTGRAWDPNMATHGNVKTQLLWLPDRPVAADQADGRGEPCAALRSNGQPRRSWAAPPVV
jgi:hypothetical protein